MERNDVARLFGQMAGIGESGAAAQMPLIDACIRQLKARVKPGAQPGEILTCACAALAACRYLLAAEPEPAVRVGEISATPEGGNSRLARAKALRDEYMLGCAPYLTDPEFVFSQAVTTCG